MTLPIRPGWQAGMRRDPPTRVSRPSRSGKTSVGAAQVVKKGPYIIEMGGISIYTRYWYVSIGMCIYIYISTMYL